LFTTYTISAASLAAADDNHARILWMDQAVIDKKVEQAEVVVNAYGAILAKLKHVNTALPNSLLPYDKETIKQAIHTLLWELDDIDNDVKSGLVQAYVFLEQFIPENKVVVLARGQAAIQSADPERDDWYYADEANTILVQIKMAMEEAMRDMSLFVHPDK
jgi:hypothetical protein